MFKIYCEKPLYINVKKNAALGTCSKYIVRSRCILMWKLDSLPSEPGFDSHYVARGTFVFQNHENGPSEIITHTHTPTYTHENPPYQIGYR